MPVIKSFMKELISFLIKNFSLTFLCLGLVISAVSLLRRPRPVSKATVADKLLSDYILYAGWPHVSLQLRGAHDIRRDQRGVYWLGQ
jgi:hypothetical protein